MRPFARDAQAPLGKLKPVVDDIASSSGDVSTGTEVLRQLFDGLAYKPAGDQLSALTLAGWLGHAGMSLTNMQDNLAEHGLTVDKVPLVMQYNKRDLPRLVSVDDMEKELNPRGAPFYEAVALRGTGVFDTLKLACKLVLKTIG